MHSHPGQGALDDEREVGWGDEPWVDDRDTDRDAEDDLARLLEDVPPHHVDRWMS